MKAGLRWADTILRTAREYELAGKQKGRMGPLGPHTREVLAALLRLIDFKTGRLDPSYARLMAMTGFCKGLIGAALNRLRAHGFLDWMRRSRLVETDDVVARQQTTNAYFFDFARMPRGAYLRFRQLLARRERAADDVPARTPAPATLANHGEGEISLPEDPALRRAILKLQASIERRAE